MQAFSYTANVKLLTASGDVSIFKDAFPGVTDLVVSSREFVDYNECITSCRQLMDDVKTRINLGSTGITFKISSEVNPVYSGTETLSKDWSPQEIARLWIFDEHLSGGKIEAVGQARVFQTNRPATVSLSS